MRGNNNRGACRGQLHFDGGRAKICIKEKVAFQARSGIPRSFYKWKMGGGLWCMKQIV